MPLRVALFAQEVTEERILILDNVIRWSFFLANICYLCLKMGRIRGAYVVIMFDIKDPMVIVILFAWCIGFSLPLLRRC